MYEIIIRDVSVDVKWVFGVKCDEYLIGKIDKTVIVFLLTNHTEEKCTA